MRRASPTCTPLHLVVCYVCSPLYLQVVLTAKGAQAGLGSIGEITKVPNGYFRNFLEPQRMALPATQGILEWVIEHFCTCLEPTIQLSSYDCAHSMQKHSEARAE